MTQPIHLLRLRLVRRKNSRIKLRTVHPQYKLKGGEIMHVFTVVWNGKVKGVYSDRNLAEKHKEKIEKYPGLYVEKGEVIIVTKTLNSSRGR